MYAIAQHGSGERRRQQDAIAGDKPSGLSELPMPRNEVGAGQAIAVKKDAIVAATGNDRAVADFRSAKAGVGLPDVADSHAKPRTPAFHHGPSRRPGAIIRDHDLEGAVVLDRQRR